MSLIRITPYAEGLTQLAKFALNRELIPIFGAGFTAGCQASSGVVPDCAGTLETMSEILEK